MNNSTINISVHTPFNNAVIDSNGTSVAVKFLCRINPRCLPIGAPMSPKSSVMYMNPEARGIRLAGCCPNNLFESNRVSLEVEVV